MTAIPRLAIEGEYAYDYLLHQITRKAELREIVQYFKQNLGQRYKQGLSVWKYCGIIYCFSKILFIAKSFAELKKHSLEGYFYIILLKIKCGKSES